ncbi:MULTISPECIES: hypothetical protein [unclassified Citrobacter]|uniref:hypothetical protein n=1 Tax=unclassified Citrobacter TaxID=2644389 RepID=UPI0023044823|nr:MULTISPECIES: hypothetical protein [unclassified Citrobacter]MDA8500492.1 hypothetical protein [Citrobacter sp. Igbk 17]MDA8511565.1 hypothetical protein [Citrobacter sp. Igbk 14]
MVRVEFNKITYDIGYENGIYFARSSAGPSPIGKTIDELSDGLSACTGAKKSDLIRYLKEILSQ